MAEDTLKQEVFNYCEERWAYYREKDKGYFPSKHDDKVFEDTAEHFNITKDDAEKMFMEISKIEAENMVKGMSKQDMAKMFDSIVKDNAETPWGMMERKKNFR